MKIPAATPESKGIPSGSILSFLSRLEEKQVPMHSFLLFCRDSIVAEGYFLPYKKETLHRMFSISKSFTAIAVGILEADGLISLTDPIIKYFPDKLPAQVHPWIAEMTIKDMLMMRTCHANTTYRGASDWVASFFTTPPTHKPGTVFHYDTSSAHVLAALVERLTKKPMLDFLKERLPELSFSDESYMLTDPDGVSMGGTGLVATTMDLLKFGILLLNKGSVNGRQMVPAGFVEDAVSCLTETVMTAPLPSEACGYGYMIWKNERDGFVCYGMGGQLLMVFPQKDLICITTADTQGIAGGNQLIYDAFYQEIYGTVTDGEAEAGSGAAALLLQQKLQALSIRPLAPHKDNTGWLLSSPAISGINGKTYTITAPGGAAPASANSIVSGFNSFTFFFRESDVCELRFVLGGVGHSLSFGFGKLAEGTFPIYNLAYAASGVWLDAKTLYVRFHIIDEYVGSVHMQFFFGENDVLVYMKKIEESCFAEFNGHFYGTYNPQKEEYL